jgi:LacI family transcriptional regulator
VNPGQEVEACDTLSIANFDGAHEMVRHLIGLGHRRIAMVRGPARNLDAEQRLQGYHAALREAGLGPAPELEVDGDFTEASGYEAVAALLALPVRPTATFVGNDHMAVGVISALRDAGVAIPEQMAVAGFDDIAMARFTSPPLTSVRVNTALLGERAVELLLRARRLGNSAPRHHELLPTSLAIRSSCGAPRPGAEEPARWRASRTLPTVAE